MTEAAAQQARAFGKYVLLQRIAAGGMAEIFKARFNAGDGIEKTCVIKRILPHLAMNEDFVTMFHDEARISTQLSHANIVQVFDFGRIEGDHFLAMEYVQGQNLQHVLKKLRKEGQTLPVPIALYIAAEIAKGLDYAHNRVDSRGEALNIVHRDISPANILLSYEGEVKIADFGIAKAASKDAATKTGHIKGKASYLAPEQLLSKDLDGRTDVFALGTCIWEMLAGQKLFSGENELEIIAKVSRIKIQPPSALNPRLPRELDGVVMKALQRNTKNRYRNASELYRALVAVIKHFGINISSTDVGSYLRNVFEREMTREFQLDRELSKSFASFDLNAAQGAGEQTQGGVSHVSVKMTKLPRSRGKRAAALFGAFLLAAGAGVWLAPQVGIELPFEVPWAVATPQPQVDVTPPVKVAKVTPTPDTHNDAKDARNRKRKKRRNKRQVMVTATPATAASEAPKPTAVAQLEYGYLSLETSVWANIYLDGKNTGRQTPAFELKVPVGKHTIKLVNPELKQEATIHVVIRKGKKIQRRVALKTNNTIGAN